MSGNVSKTLQNLFTGKADQILTLLLSYSFANRGKNHGTPAWHFTETLYNQTSPNFYGNRVAALIDKRYFGSLGPRSSFRQPIS